MHFNEFANKQQDGSIAKTHNKLATHAALNAGPPLWLDNDNNNNNTHKSDANTVADDYQHGYEDDQPEGNNGTTFTAADAQPVEGIDRAALLDLLPHLNAQRYRHLRNLNAKVLSSGRSPSDDLTHSPEIVLMVPTTYRKEHNYLLDTLQNLVDNISDEERHMVQIVVQISENQWDSERDAHLINTVAEIDQRFGTETAEGLIDVIAPPPEWFPPDLQKVRQTLGDPPDRMRWRTKQNFDYAFAMLHVQKQRPNAKFYVQLEDDIITLPNFVSELHRFASAHPDFFMIEFANLGFIGRMFHNNIDLAQMAHHILLLARHIPVDWVLSRVLTAKFCSLDETPQKCWKQRITDVVVFRRQPPLFQHIGRHSSLPGKVQNLTEKQFKQNAQIEPLFTTTTSSSRSADPSIAH